LGSFSATFLSLFSRSSSTSTVVVADFLGQADVLGCVVFGGSPAFLSRGLEIADGSVAARLGSRISRVAFLIRSVDLSVTADEVSFGGVRILCLVLFVASSGKVSEDGGEEVVLEPSEVNDDGRGTDGDVASGGVIGIGDQTNNFIICSGFGGVIGSDNSTSLILGADTLESAVSLGDGLGLDAKVLKGIEQVGDTRGCQVLLALVAFLQEHFGEFQVREAINTRSLVSVSNSVEVVRRDG